jgi:pyridoxamine 5'-phosphate oxidase family protein
MSAFTEREVEYLTGERRLARIATVGTDGTPHVVPVRFDYNAEIGTIDVPGRGMETSKKFRHVRQSGRAAIVVDDVAGRNPWRPRAVEVRGGAEALEGPPPLIRIHPEWIASWGVEADGKRNERPVR